MARAYDPGTPTAAVRDADGTFLVKSFRGDHAAYRVDLAGETCSCPDHTRRRRECKHLIAVKQQAQWLGYVEKARQLADGDLNRLLAKYAENALISGALRVVRAERRQQAAS